jgi:thymidine phosphorylase
MVAELGGPADLVGAPERHLPGAPVTVAAEPSEAGVVAGVDVRAVGLAVVALGGGRLRESDPVDHSVGLADVAAPGEPVGPGERPLALVHAASEESAQRAVEALREAYRIGDPPADETPIVLETLR